MMVEGSADSDSGACEYERPRPCGLVRTDLRVCGLSLDPATWRHLTLGVSLACFSHLPPYDEREMVRIELNHRSSWYNSEGCEEITLNLNWHTARAAQSTDVLASSGYLWIQQ